jgi:hypothetical protein
MAVSEQRLILLFIVFVDVLKAIEVCQLVVVERLLFALDYLLDCRLEVDGWLCLLVLVVVGIAA